MHGDKSQNQRQNALARFDRGQVAVLVATDVAARGIDVPEISHVVQFDAPEDGDTYTHRVGRTGRAGASGHGVSYVLGDQAHEMRKMAASLGLANEFDRREGAEHGGGRPASRPQGGGHGRNHNHKRKQGGGGSTGPRRRRNRNRSRSSAN
jgi:superfamily II DNA/RNA helicase